MHGIEIVYENGKMTIKNSLMRRYEPVILTLGEESAVSIIYECLSCLDCKVHLERRSDSYLSIVANENSDFCRVKVGVRSIWFSVFMFKIKELFADDPRLSCVKNKNKLHWKIYLNTIDELKQYADIIQHSCRSVL